MNEMNYWWWVQINGGEEKWEKGARCHKEGGGSGFCGLKGLNKKRKSKEKEIKKIKVVFGF